MEIVVSKPPMWEEINEAFNVEGKAVIFSWGHRIYNPQNLEISGALMAHEAVHGQRQGTEERKIAEWWKQYIIDPKFRYTEELAAHRAEYRAMKSWTKDRNQSSKYLHQVAQRLASPLYGGVVTHTEARRAIAAER